MAEEDRTELSSPPERLRRLLATAITSHRPEPTGKALALLVGTPQPDSRAEWYRAFMVVWGLIDEAEAFVRSRVENFSDSPHGKTFQELRAVLGQMQLEKQWAGHADSLSHLVSIALPFVVFSAQAGLVPPTVRRADLDSIRASVADLVGTIRSAELPTAVEETLIAHVRDLITALSEFELYGAEGIQRATNALIIVLATYKDVVSDKATLLEKTATVITKIEDVIIKAATIAAIAGPTVLKLLHKG